MRFPGQYYDKETGLHYNYHRYYDPTSGRYLRPDPLGLPAGINLYVYAINNPIRRYDFFGLCENCDFLETQENLVGGYYIWGGNDPRFIKDKSGKLVPVDLGGVDCSGAVLYGLKKMGYDIPDQSAHDIYNNLTEEVSEEDLKPGDLIFYDYRSDGKIDHVTTYTGIARVNPRGGSKNTSIKNPGWISISPGKGKRPIYRRIKWNELNKKYKKKESKK